MHSSLSVFQPPDFKGKYIHTIENISFETTTRDRICKTAVLKIKDHLYVIILCITKQEKGDASHRRFAVCSRFHSAPAD